MGSKKKENGEKSSRNIAKLRHHRHENDSALGGSGNDTAATASAAAPSSSPLCSVSGKMMQSKNINSADNEFSAVGAVTGAHYQGQEQSKQSGAVAAAAAVAAAQATREKIIEKKRKRMNMRREYEEEVQRQMQESSESSTGTSTADAVLKPGKPITLDKVLSFTKTARLVIQASPPFLVVHANAAYTALTGLDSHAAIGRPISYLMSLPETTSPQGPSNNNSARNDENNRDTNNTSVAANSLMQHHQALDNGQQQQRGQYLQDDDQPNLREEVDSAASVRNDVAVAAEAAHAAAAAAGHARATAVQDDPQELCLELLVAACGFGNFHNVNVSARPQHNHSVRTVTVMHAHTSSVDPPPSLLQSQNSFLSSSQQRPDSIRMYGDNHSPNSSIESKNTVLYSVGCRMGVSPVVDSTNTMDSAVVTDKDQDNYYAKHHHSTTRGRTEGSTTNSAKRRKHHHHHRHAQEHTFSRNRRQRLLGSNNGRSSDGGRRVTHYVIQLELIDGKRKFFSRASFSSTSTNTTAEAAILGLTKVELRQRRQLKQQQQASDMGVSLQGGDGNNPHNPSDQPTPHDPSLPRSSDDDTQDSSSDPLAVATCG
uniref:PAS domain-containing protein n=2 Tax=Ditylum brightwellii TaxID=49249 RepID=A0A7S2EVQ8_9STRA